MRTVVVGCMVLALLAVACAKSEVTVELATGAEPAVSGSTAGGDPSRGLSYTWELEVEQRIEESPGRATTYVIGGADGDSGFVRVDVSELIEAYGSRDVFLDIPDPSPPLEWVFRDGHPYAVRGVTRAFFPFVFDADPSLWYAAGPLAAEKIEEDEFSPFLAAPLVLGLGQLTDILGLVDGELVGDQLIDGVETTEMRYLVDSGGLDRDAGPLADLFAGDLSADAPIPVTLFVDEGGTVRRLETAVPDKVIPDDATTAVLTVTSFGDPVPITDPDPLARLPRELEPAPVDFSLLGPGPAGSTTVEYELGLTVFETEGAPFSLIVRVAEDVRAERRRVSLDYTNARQWLARSLSGFADELVEPLSLPGLVESVYAGDTVATIGLTAAVLGPDRPTGIAPDSIDPNTWYAYDLFGDEFLTGVTAPLFDGIESVAAELGDSQSVDQIGPDQIDGITMTQWSFTVTPDRHAAAAGLAGLLGPFQGFTYPRADGRAWVDESGVVRRVEVRWFNSTQAVEPVEVTELRLVSAGLPVTVDFPAEVVPLG